MIRTSVKVQIDEMRAQFPAQQREVRLAASRAINRSADAGRAAGVREVSIRTKLKAAKMRAHMRVIHANPNELFATILAMGYAPNLKEFAPQYPANAAARRKAAGVSANAWEARKTYRHSFRLPSGAVVRRTGRGRFPLKGLRGPSLPKSFMRPEVLRAVLVKVYERFPREFEREIGRRLG